MTRPDAPATGAGGDGKWQGTVGRTEACIACPRAA